MSGAEEERRLVQERIEGDGDVEWAYRIITYWGPRGGYAPKEQATGFAVCDYDSAGRLLEESFGDYDHAEAVRADREVDEEEAAWGSRGPAVTDG